MPVWIEEEEEKLRELMQPFVDSGLMPSLFLCVEWAKVSYLHLSTLLNGRLMFMCGQEYFKKPKRSGDALLRKWRRMNGKR